MLSLAMFVTNLGLVAGLVLLFAACGWWAISPFRRQFAYPLAQAPLAGMILASLGTLSVTVVLNIEFRLAAIVAIVVLCAASLASAYSSRGVPIAEWPFLLALAIAVSCCAVWYMTRTDLFFGAPGLTYALGTDHLGYAHLADWLRLHPGDVTFAPDPEDWYGSFPQYTYHYDPRFGTFTFLALVSLFSGRSGAFAYDLASAAAISAATLGVAATFARRRRTCVVLAVALFTGFLFDWNRAGFLGKTTAYPGTLLAAGLFLAWVEEARREGTCPMIALAGVAAVTAGVAVMFSGVVTGLFLALIGSLYLAMMAVPGGRPVSPAPSRDATAPWVVLGLLVALSILSSGIVARPLIYGSVPLPWSWRYLLIQAVEVEGMPPGRTGLRPGMMWAIAVALLVVWALLGALAVFQRIAPAAALLIGPLLLLACLYAADLRWHAMIFIGSYGAMLLCGSAAMIDATAGPGHGRWVSPTVLCALLLCIGSHLPRFAATARYQGGKDTPALLRFSSTESDALAAAIQREGGSAMVDTGETPHFSAFLMVELGRRGIPLQWSEQCWKLIVGYRPWPVPKYAKAAPLKIVLRTDRSPGSGTPILRTTQFELRRQP